MKHNQLFVMTLIFLLLLAGGAGQIRAADAVVGDGSPASCTEAAFDTALAAAGGGEGRRPMVGRFRWPPAAT